MEIGAELRDAGGKVIKRFPWRRANSLLKQFIQILMVQFSQASTTIKDVSGNDRACLGYATNQKMVGAVNDVNNGIVIGTGTTAVTMTDNKLETQVSVNVAHAAAALAVENPDASTWRISIARGFTNNTGASLGVREVGIYAYMTVSQYLICVDRTLYSVDVPTGVTLTLTYRLTVSL